MKNKNGVTTTFRLSEAEYTALKALCNKNQTTISGHIRALIRASLAQAQNEGEK